MTTSVMIHNGLDPERVVPGRSAEEVRRSFGIGEGTGGSSACSATSGPGKARMFSSARCRQDRGARAQSDVSARRRGDPWQIGRLRVGSSANSPSPITVSSRTSSFFQNVADALNVMELARPRLGAARAVRTRLA